MNYLKNLWHTTSAQAASRNEPYLKYTGEGSFYQIKNGNKEVIHDSAKIGFGISDVEFVYSLYIENMQRRTTRRGANKENMINENSFPISEKLHLTTNYERKNNEDVMSFEWRSEENTVYGFEFRNKKRNLVAAYNFKELFCKLLYQVKYRTYVSEQTPVHDYINLCTNKLDEPTETRHFIHEEKCLTPKEFKEVFGKRNSSQKSKGSLPYKRNSSPKGDKMEIEWEKSRSHSSNKSKSSRGSRKSASLSVQPPAVNLLRNSSGSLVQPKSQPLSECLTINEKGFSFKRVGDLYQLDEAYQFILMQENSVLGIRHLDKLRFQLEIYDPGNTLLYLQILEDNSCYFIDFEGEIFKWFDVQDDVLRVIGFKFHDDPLNALEQLGEVLANDASVQGSNPAISSGSNKGELSSINDSAVRTNLLVRYEEEFSGFVEPIKEFIEIEDDEPGEKFEEEDPEMDFNNDDEEEDEGEGTLLYKKVYKYYEPPQNNNSHYPSHNIFQSKLLDRVFVSRGPVISVFKANDSLEFICNLPNLTTLGNEIIHPKKILFHNSDTKMLILNETLDKKIYSLDLEKGQITNEWTLDGYNSILDVDHLHKNGELSHDDFFIGINNRNIFQFNPQNEEAPLVKNYSTNPKFSAFSTTSKGHFAVGSLTGDLRLYKEIGQNAKNLIQGTGNSIIGVDSTKDGSLLVTTMENYILVHQILFNEVSGYISSIKKFKNDPIKLFLPSHVAETYGLESIRFTKAKFDNVYARSEQYIVSTVGRLLVVWKLIDVLSYVNEPKVFGLKSTILDCEFRNDRDDAIVAILEDEVNYILI